MNELSTVIGLLNRPLESLEAILLGEPGTIVSINTLKKIIDVQGELISVHKSRIAIMEGVSDPAVSSENQKITDLNTAIITNYLRRGELLLDDGRFQEALNNFSTLRVKDRECLPCTLGTIRAEIGLRHYATALDVLFTAVAHYPDEAEFLSLRAETYKLLGWAEKADREIQRYQRFVEDGVPPLWDEAWVEYIEMLDVLPDMKAMAIESSRFDTGVSSEWVYARTAAEQALKECAKSTDHDCKLYALGNEIVWGATDEELARIYEGLDFGIGSTPRELTGVRHLEEWVIRMQVRDATVEIKAGNLRYFVLRANHNRELGELRRALSDVNNYLRSFPETPSVLLLRGSINLEIRRFEQAIADFRRIIEISPQSKVAALSHSGIAGAFLMQNDYESAIQEYQAADLPEHVQQFLDNGMCVALSRRALPAAALPYCNLAILGHRGKNVAEFYSSRAFALWQLHRNRDSRSDLLVARQADPRLPDVDSRIGQFRTLIVEIFLQEKGYTTGLVDGINDSVTRAAVTAYQTDENLPTAYKISDDLVGGITTLGFGMYRLTAVGDTYNRDIVKICKPATMGELTILQTTDQLEYICNTDGESVRPGPNTPVKSVPSTSPVELIHPQQLDYSTRKSRYDLRCYSPNTGIVFSPVWTSSDTDCGPDSYRISEDDFQRIIEEKSSTTIRDQGQVYNIHGTLNLGTNFFSQSITAGITGELAAIEVLYEYGIVAPIQFSIYAGGNPVTGAPLYTELIKSPVFEEGGEVFRWLLPSNTLFFEEGEQFTFAFQAQNSRVIFSAGDRWDYYGGELFQNGVPSPRADDVAFITYVVPAESPRLEANVEVPEIQLFGDGTKVVIQSNIALKAGQFREFNNNFSQGKEYFGAFAVNRTRDTFFYFNGFHSLEVANQFAIMSCRNYSIERNHDPDKCVLYANLIPTSVKPSDISARGMGYPSYTAFVGEYKNNQIAGKFGAFAVSGMSEDGYSWGYASKEGAIDEAVSVCEGWAARHIAGNSKSDRDAIEGAGLTDCRVVHISGP